MPNPAALEARLSAIVGGTGLKASVLDRAGKMLVDRIRVATPYPCPPRILLRTLTALVTPLPAFDRISVGFPGVVRDGRTLTAPHFGDRPWRDFPLAAALSKRLGKPVRLHNDAEVQGFGIVKGRGLEVVLTLGTGAGTAVFRDGVLMPHLELAQHPIHDNQTYNDYIGSQALRREGAKKWSHRVRKTIKILNSLLHYDVLYLGGGNGDKVINPPRDVRIASNHAEITGGIRLWDADVEQSLFHGAATAAGRRGRATSPSGRNKRRRAPLRPAEGDRSWPRFSIATSMTRQRLCHIFGSTRSVVITRRWRSEQTGGNKCGAPMTSLDFGMCAFTACWATTWAR
jgi:polyphosphate glucokinase